MQDKKAEKIILKAMGQAVSKTVDISMIIKVTEAELSRWRQRSWRRRRKMRRSKVRMTDEEVYEKIVLVENVNKDDSVIEARSVEEALVKIAVTETSPIDKHPEKRLKASFKVLVEKLPELLDSQRRLCECSLTL